MTELSSEAKALLRQARRGFSPPAGRLEAIRSAVQAQIAASPGALSSMTSPASGVAARALAGAGWNAGYSVGAALLIGALGAGGIVGWLGAGRSTAASGPSSAPNALFPAPPALPSPIEPTAPLADTPPTPLTTVETPAEGMSIDLTPSPKSASAPRDRARGPVRARNKAETAPESGAALASDSLAEEVRMLRSARAALDRGDPMQALRLVDAHETRFHRGTLYEERLAARVLALCALGRADAARAAAQELEHAAPRSPHLPRVRASCIAQPTNK
jgi:hypothetical protein